ncbi:MAG: phage tail tape measure protein, partial [Psychroserpens sp.]|nr:phage tail tape measure protein [Psychroserpens sp.]
MAGNNDVAIKLAVEDLLSKKYKQIHQEIQRLNKATSNSGKKLADDTAKNTKKMETGMDKARKAAKGFKEGIGSAAKQFGPAAVAVIALTSAFRAVGSAIDFVNSKTSELEKTLSTVKAILRPTADEFSRLASKSKELGITTAFSASQSAQAFVEMGKLGLNTNQIIAASADVLNIAAAANIELARAAELTVITMKQFGLNADQATRITDVMSESFTKSALDAEKFGEAMKFAGPTAAQFGVSLEVATGAMAELSNSAVTGSMAGTAMRRILLELGDANGK